MARARNIKPGFFANEYLASLSPHARLLFIGLWTLADREGRLEDRPTRIKGQLFPYEDIDVDSCLNQLCGKHEPSMTQDQAKHDSSMVQACVNHESCFIVRYQIGGKKFIQIMTWHKHQAPHHKEVASEIPPFSMLEPSLNQACVNVDSSMTQACVNQNASCPTDSLNPLPDSPSPHPSNATPSLNAGGGWIPRGVVIPESILGDDAFRDLLKDWASYIASKSGSVNVYTFQSHVEKLAGYGYESAKRAVETSIERGWLAPDWVSAGKKPAFAKVVDETPLSVADIFGENCDD